MARRRNQAARPADGGGDKRRPAPKGRPTPGKKQRAEAARRRARRRRIQVWAWWGLLIAVIVGALVYFAVTGVGQPDPAPVGLIGSG